jgi:hypothetical protein
MTGEGIKKLRSLLQSYGQRPSKAQPEVKPTPDEGERRRRVCGERLQQVVRPVLVECSAELRDAGQESAVDDHTDTANAYPSVALAFTPRAPGRTTLTSVLTFRYDPRRGVAVARDIKPAPQKGRVVTSSTDRIGTMRVEAVTAEWVESKTLSFIEAVLKVN